MNKNLISLGLSSLQAQVYLYLIKHGPKTPKELVGEVSITRTNAYKVLESLEKLDLVSRSDTSRKLLYAPADPSVLAGLVAKKRNEIIALEKQVNDAMGSLRNVYQKKANNGLSVVKGSGPAAMVEAYQKQAQLQCPIYFFKSRADTPFMGFETMHKIRLDQGINSPARFGITTDSTEAPINDEIDKKVKLTRTWIDQSAYTAPVEWSVSGDSLLIQIFENNGQLIEITDPQVAESFRQIWQLANRAIRKNENYASRPNKAARKV